MQCPACQSQLIEGQSLCGTCGFALTAADKVFGVPPRLLTGISDLASVFDAADHRRIDKSLNNFRRTFPQTTPTLVTFSLQRGWPFQAYVFWLFNRSGIGSQLERGSANRCVLVALEISTRKAAVMIGYGLEPFIPVSVLDAAVTSGSDALKNARFAESAVQILEALTDHFVRISAAIPMTYGIQWDDIMANDSRWRDQKLDSEDGLY